MAGIECSPKIFDFRANGIPVQESVDFFDTLKQILLFLCFNTEIKTVYSKALKSGQPDFFYLSDFIAGKNFLTEVFFLVTNSMLCVFVFVIYLKLDKMFFESDKISLLCGLSYYVKIILVRWEKVCGT